MKDNVCAEILEIMKSMSRRNRLTAWIPQADWSTWETFGSFSPNGKGCSLNEEYPQRVRHDS